ncbi:hypothetical protein GCM10010272_56360 [Streptomyces lateritius]|nr:hypothetical protein GCM10010272_56360 [Streptomyces lateritius]
MEGQTGREDPEDDDSEHPRPRPGRKQPLRPAGGEVGAAQGGHGQRRHAQDRRRQQLRGGKGERRGAAPGEAAGHVREGQRIARARREQGEGAPAQQAGAIAPRREDQQDAGEAEEQTAEPGGAQRPFRPQAEAQEQGPERRGGVQDTRHPAVHRPLADAEQQERQCVAEEGGDGQPPPGAPVTEPRQPLPRPVRQRQQHPRPQQAAQEGDPARGEAVVERDFDPQEARAPEQGQDTHPCRRSRR